MGIIEYEDGEGEAGTDIREHESIEKNENQEEIEELQEAIEKLEAEKEKLENNENTDEYDDMLDDCNPEIKIGSMTYSPSHVLKNIDEIAYNCGMNEYNDEKISELQDEIKNKEQELEELKSEVTK